MCSNKSISWQSVKIKQIKIPIMNSVMLNQVSRFVGFFKKVFTLRSNRFEKPKEFWSFLDNYELKIGALVVVGVLAVINITLALSKLK